MKKFLDNFENFVPWLILLLMHSAMREASVLSSLSVLLLLVSFFKLGKETKGVALILFVAPILALLFRLSGFIITAYPITLALGLYLLRQHFREIINNSYVILSYLGLVIILILWFVYGPQHAYAQTKLIVTIVVGMGSVFAWAFLMNINPDEARKLARLLIAISLLYMSIALEFFGFPYPSSLLDFDLFRIGFYDYIHINDDLPFTYHSMGIPILLASALILGSSNPFGGRMNLNHVFFLFLCLYLVLLSQARQAILGIFLIIALRVWVSHKLSSAGKITLVFLVIGAFIFMLTGIETTAFTQATSEGSLSINRSYARSFDLINEHLILGVGLGGYSLTGLREYPHSILWELLSEFGFLGTFLVVFLSVGQIARHPRKALYYTNKYGQIPFLIVAAFGVRALSSSDLMENIVWIVALIIYSSVIRKSSLSLR